MAVKTTHRKIADAQRRTTVQKSNGFARSLAAYRRKEITRVIRLAEDSADARNWASFFEANFSEAKYFPSWYKSLVGSCGMLSVRTTAKLLAGDAVAKTLETGVFEKGLLDYAERRAGELIVTVRGTMLEALKDEIRTALAEDINISVEAMAERLQSYTKDNLLWQARRIAQTEGLAGLAEGASEAARELDTPCVKEWLCSGLTNSRESHLAMDGMRVDMDDWFVFDDCKMRYAHDIQNGTAAQVINCACTTLYIPKE